MELHSKESFPKNIKRIALALNARSAEALMSALGKEHEAIHTVRKNLKQMRSLLRLARESLGNEIYVQENMFYRNAGREISEIRDATSVMEALDKLQALFKKELRQETCHEVRKRLVQKRDALADELLQGHDLLQQVQGKISQGSERIAVWSIKDIGFKTVKPGLRSVYAQGYDLMAKAKGDPGTVNMHEWRKQAKYLMYHIRMLKPVWPEILLPLEAEINLLTDHLGDDHDLSLLEQEIQSHLTEEDLALPITLIHHRRKALQQLAFLQGERIYAINPYAYADQFEAYWKSWMARRK